MCRVIGKANDGRNGVPVKCYNCDKNAICQVGPEGQQVPIRLDCYIRWQNIHIRRQETLAREVNFLTEQMESIVGLQGILPKYPEPQAVIHTGGVTMNNINVSNSKIGILNTGTIENVDNTVTVLRTQGNEQLASAVTLLSESVIKSAQVATDQKNQILELLSSLSEEAVAPKGKRKLAGVRAVLVELSGLLGGVAALAQVWEKVRSLLQQVFGL